jgi:hypothetical protein
MRIEREIICGRRRKWSIYNNNNHKFISGRGASVRSRRVYRYTFSPQCNGERKRVTQLLQIVDLFWVHIIVGLCWRGRSELFRSTGLALARLYQMMDLQRSRADLLQSVNTPGQRPVCTIYIEQSTAFFTGISRRSGRSLKSDVDGKTKNAFHS